MRRNWPMLLLAIIFITPFLVAFVVLMDTDNQHTNTTQHGNFIDVPDHIIVNILQDLSGNTIEPNLAQNKWQVVYLQPTPCTTECTDQMHVLQNLHKALGKDRNRVLFARSNNMPTGLASDANIVVVDPKGHAIMYYTPEHEASGLLKDLRKLLKYSHA